MNFTQYRNRIHSEVNEALLPREESDADSMAKNGHSYYLRSFHASHPKAAEAFSTRTEGKPFRARFPVSLTDESSNPHQGVVGFLQEHGYSTNHDLYKKGLAESKIKTGDESKGIPIREKVVQTKIGGLLDKHSAPDDIKKSYMNDSFRSGAKTSDYDVVLSGHPHDVYSMSTGRGWTSCAQKRKGEDGYDGPAAQKMDKEIQHLTHVAYLVPRGGNPDTQAVGRISYKHHTDILTGHQTLVSDNQVYGTPPTGFLPAANKIVDSLFEKKPGSVYVKNESVYNDNGKVVHVSSGEIHPEHLDKIWKESKPGKEYSDADNFRELLKLHVDHNSKYKTKTLNDLAKTIHSVHTANSSGNFNDVLNSVKVLSGSIPEKHHYKYVHDDNKVSNDINGLLDTGSKQFNMHDPSHVSKIGHIKEFGTHIGNAFYRKLIDNIPKAKTYSDYTSLKKLNDSGVQLKDTYYQNDHIPISEKHELGRNPLDTIVHGLSTDGKLDHKNFMQAVSSTKDMNSRKGSAIDHAVKFENDGIPGMSQVINHYASAIDNSAKNPKFLNKDKSYEEIMTKHYSDHKPATRQRIADILGHDYKKIMRVGKAKD